MRKSIYSLDPLFLTGCLMVIAWIGFASIGMFIARHMKVLFGQRVLLGTKMWFTVRLLFFQTQFYQNTCR